MTTSLFVDNTTQFHLFETAQRQKTLDTSELPGLSKTMNTKFMQRRQFIKLASGLMVTPFASLTGGAAAAQAGTSPLRMLTIIETYGVPFAERASTWISSSAGDYALSDDNLGTILAPFKAYKENLLVCSGNHNTVSGTGGSRTHHHLAANLLTGSNYISGSGASAKLGHASLDYHIGQHLNVDRGLARAFPHLYLSTNAQSSDTTFCYDESGNQVRALASPINQANAVFTSDADLSGLQFQNATQQNIFALVQQQIQALRGQLNNASNATIMDAYESSVDDLAAQIQLSSDNVCGVPSDYSSFPTNITQSTDSTPAIFNNIKQMFSCDLASSVSFAFGGEKINQLKHAALYDAEAHADATVQSLLSSNQHSMSHSNSAASNKAHEIVRVHQAEETAKLLDYMSVTPDVDGNSLLDNTLVYMTSTMANNTHNVGDYCQLLIAGKNTNLKGGYHYDLDGHTNSELLTTIAQGMGLSDDSFGGQHKNGNYVDSINGGPITKMLLS